MASMFSCVESSFCTTCGALLPVLPAAGDVVCKVCKSSMSINLFADSETHYSVVFNKALGQKGLKKKKRKDGDSDIEDAADGPIIERRCPKCGHERMSYSAAQLRSADEGQTVFFTCLKCKFKENENS